MKFHPLASLPTIAACVLAAVATGSAGRANAGHAERLAAIEEAMRGPIIAPDVTLLETRAFVERGIPTLSGAYDSASAWQAEADRLRRRVLEDVVLRGEARRWAGEKLGAEWLDVIEGLPGYRIRKLRYEAIPGLWIPAVLYEPAGLAAAEAGQRARAPRPAVLNVHGHDPKGMAADYKQILCINLVKRGMLVLSVEWLGMGQLRCPANAHAVMNQIDLCGTSGLAPFYLLLKRGIDVMLDHPHADPARVAVSGLSGGGWQTITIGALDTRVTLANPVAGYSSFLTRNRHLKDLGDSEQTPTDLATVADYAHYTAMMAPRATLLTYNTKDNCCFEAGYALPPLVEAARPIFALFGRPDRLRTHLNADPGDHNFGLDNRQALYRMIGDHFFPEAPAYVREELSSDAEVRTAERLEVPLPEDNASLNGLAAALAQSLPREGRLPTADEPLEDWQAGRREALRQILRWPVYENLRAERLATRSVDGVDITPLRITLDDTWTVPAVEFAPAAAMRESLLLADTGMADLAGRVVELLARGQRVLAVDPFYFGQAKFPSHDYLQALIVATTGRRALGIQAAQVAAVAGWMRRERRTAPAVEAHGWRTSLIALAAAAAEPDAIGGVTLVGARASLREVIERNDPVTAAPEAFCFGLLERFDTPQLGALVVPRPLTIVNASPRHAAVLSELRSLAARVGGSIDLRPPASAAEAPATPARP